MAILHALDISCVVLAGGLDSLKRSLPPKRLARRWLAFSSMAEGVSVLTGTLHEDAGIVGAASIANGLKMLRFILSVWNNCSAPRGVYDIADWRDRHDEGCVC